MSAYRAMKMIFLEVVLFILVFWIWYSIVGEENFVKTNLLAASSLERAGVNEVRVVVDGVIDTITKNHLLLLGFVVLMSVGWFAVGRLARINTPGEVKGYLRWWVLFLLLGLLFSGGAYYLLIWSHENLKPAARIWIGFVGLLFYILTYYMATLWFSPVTVQSIVPGSSLHGRQKK